MASTKDDISLLEHLDIQQTTCLNEGHQHTLASILATRARNTSNAYLESDADAQLLLSIHFNQAVRVRSLVLRGPPKCAPKTLKLLVNMPAISFDDVDRADDTTFAQIVTLSAGDVQGKPVPLRLVRFTKVNSLHIFVESNQDDEEQTRIDAIDVLGVPVEATRSLSGLGREDNQSA